MFKVSPVFQRNYASTKPAVVNQGGTSSGKTISILQVLFVLLAATPNQVCTVVGQDIPNLKKGAIRDAQNIVRASEPLQPLLKGYNKSDRIYEYHNGSIMEFTSYDDFQDAKSGKRDYLFINEANGIDKPIIDELMLRTRIRTFIDYNPTSEFWAHELHGQPDVEVIISDHRHNPFLSPAEHAKIEALKTKDLELWRVYARGMTGRIKGLCSRSGASVKRYQQVPSSSAAAWISASRTTRPRPSMSTCRMASYGSMRCLGLTPASQCTTPRQR